MHNSHLGPGEWLQQVDEIFSGQCLARIEWLTIFSNQREQKAHGPESTRGLASHSRESQAQNTSGNGGFGTIGVERIRGVPAWD